MEKKIRARSKQAQENNEKFQRFRSKIKKTFTQSFTRSVSTPRSQSNKKILSSNELNKKSARNKSIDAPRNLLSAHRGSVVNSNTLFLNQGLEKNQSINDKICNNFHHFVSLTARQKHIYCDFCQKEFNTFEKMIECKYCHMTSHKKCFNSINLKCEVNQKGLLNDLIDLDEIYQHKNTQVPKPVNSYVVKLRKKMTNLEQSFINCKNQNYNFYNGGAVSMINRESLTSVTSALSTSSSISQNSYDFTTLDCESINEYNIEVNPIIIQKHTVGIKEVLEPLKKDRESCHIESAVSDVSSTDLYCRPSYIYRDTYQEIFQMDWSKDDLENRSKLFNKNNFGLHTEVKIEKNEVFLLGTVLVHINLLRPISIELTSRPLSIYDLISNNAKADSFHPDTKIETVWLPRGTSKRLYVNQSTNTTELITGLLRKFRIKASPQKFGLYEHTIEGERKVSVRKLMDIECPLALLLMWSSEGIEKFNEVMSIKRLVLQENETGDIEWTKFSKYELLNFLLILEREEQEKSKDIELKYSILKNEIIRFQILSKPTKKI